MKYESTEPNQDTIAMVNEVIADAMETILSDGAVMEDLATYDKSIWEKVKGFIVKLIDKIKKAYAELSPNSQAAKVLRETVEDMSELQRLWAEGVIEAGERTRTAETLTRMNEEKMHVSRKYSVEYENAETNSDIIAMVDKVKSGNFKDNEKVPLGTVPNEIANVLYKLTGVQVSGFKVAMEARQVEHILKDHGENGSTDRSMADPKDIAKMEYALKNPDDIRKAGKTQAYSYMSNGRNRTADTVLYEKNIGEKSYYVVQAVPDTKAKTLYVVTAFIGKEGYKKEAPQLINAERLDATPENGSANTSIGSIAQPEEKVKRKFSISEEPTKTKPFKAAEARMEADAAARAEAKAKAAEAEAETEGKKIPDVSEFEDETPLEAAARRMRACEAEEKGDVWTLEDEDRRWLPVRHLDGGGKRREPEARRLIWSPSEGCPNTRKRQMVPKACWI